MFWGNKFICDLKKKTFQIDIFKKKRTVDIMKCAKSTTTATTNTAIFFSYDNIGRKK